MCFCDCKRIIFQLLVQAEYLFHGKRHICGEYRMNSLKLADDVGHYFVSADVAVGVEFLAGAAFENSMKAAYKAFVYWVVYMI